MKRTKAILIFSNLTAALLVVTFSTAVVSKMFGFTAFRYNLGETSGLKDWAELLSYFLLSLYLSAIILLCVNRLRMTGFYLSFTLLLIYSVYIGILFSTNQAMPCTCIGILDKFTWKQNLIFSVVMLIIISITVLMQHLHKNKIINQK